MSEKRSLALKLALLRRRRRLDIVPFPQQDAFVEDPSTAIAALCTRRAGKTNALARRFYKTMMKYPGCLCVYIALTREAAQTIMWPALEDQNEKENWGATLVDSRLEMHLPNGSKLKLYGADMKNFIRRLRGIKTPGAAIDEAQEFGSHIVDLIDNILTPATADYTDGWIALTGTPGALTKGYFFEVTEQKLHGFNVHKWSLYQNPFMPDPRGFVQRLKEKKKWDDDHPTLLREYGGKWVMDRDALLIKYDPTRDHYEDLPKIKWHYIMGVDIGLRDADAIAILAWSDASPNIYLVEEDIGADQDITDLTERIEKYIKKYNPDKIVMDEGGLGAKIAEEIRRRKGIPVHAADKARKMENVALLNDWLRHEKFKAKKTSQFAEDCGLVQIDYEKSTPDKIMVKKGYHSDINDSVLYAFKESPAYTFQAQSPTPQYGTPEWFENEVDEMERAAEERMAEQSQEAYQDDWDNW